MWDQVQVGYGDLQLHEHAKCCKHAPPRSVLGQNLQACRFWPSTLRPI